jgi:hypothetical protein
VLSAKGLIINPKDNVAVALEDIPANSNVEILKVTGDRRANEVNVFQGIAFAHKIAIRQINKGNAIIKYGVPIAYATSEIAVGEWVHTHNAKSYSAAQCVDGE